MRKCEYAVTKIRFGVGTNNKEPMLVLFCSLVWLAGAVSPKPFEMRDTRWVTSFAGTNTPFSRPECKPNAFNAVCIKDGTTLQGLLGASLPGSYLLTDVEWNVYGVTGETSARGFNVFVVRFKATSELTGRT